MHVAVLAALVLLHGTVTRPTMPPRPAAHITLVIVSQGGKVTRVRTDGRGRFAVRLPTGSYSIRSPRTLPGAVWLIGPMQVDFIVKR
jgi:hypothetical protein